MCGIAGILARQLISKNAVAIQRMTMALRHRGPDDEGFLAVNVETHRATELAGPDSRVTLPRIETFQESAHLFLGHRRLSILDLSPAGHQPLANADRTIWLVFNGEIYNYLELRDELRSAGYCFRTQSDTEVLLAAYERWGFDCLNRFNGMWAFVLYDQNKKLLFGSRDRFGVKPLYYYKDEQRFAFASETKALLKLDFIEKKINPNVVFDYLVLELDQNSTEGFLKNIYELPASHAFTHDLMTDQFRQWRYYTLAYTDRWESFDPPQFQHHVEQLRTRLVKAVELRLRADVTVGSCLSGGLDSSSIVCITNQFLKTQHSKQLGEQQQVFTTCYEDPRIDERQWVKQVVEQTGVSWHQTFPTSQTFCHDLEDLIYTQDMPFKSTSQYAQYCVMKLAHEHGIKVLLDGQGGDELFTGYPGFYRAYFLEILRHVDIKTLLRETAGLRNAPTNLGYIFLAFIRNWGINFIPAKSLSPVFKAIRPEPHYLQAEFWQNNIGRLAALREKSFTSLNQMLHATFHQQCLQPLLRYEDRSSMRFSIESRTPFADDHPLIESVYQIPAVYKIHQGWSKTLLRHAMTDIVPNGICRRKDKLGFATPEYDWLNAVRPFLPEYQTADLKNYMDLEKLLKNWDQMVQPNQRRALNATWRYINFAIWKKINGV